MVNDALRNDLAAAEESFEISPVTIEDGLDVDDPVLVQLRRACRLLAAGSYLLERGYYTVVIESSFVSIERTIQFRLIHDGALARSDTISSHRRLYQRGVETGLYDDQFGDKLANLWTYNRTKTYYRLGIATEEQAEAMHRFATNFHNHLVSTSRIKHECLCDP